MKLETVKKYELVLQSLNEQSTKGGFTTSEIGTYCKLVKTNAALYIYMKKLSMLRIAPNQSGVKERHLKLVLADGVGTNLSKSARKLHAAVTEASKLYQREKQKQTKLPIETKVAMNEVKEGKLKNAIDITEIFTEEKCITFLKNKGYRIMKPITDYKEV